MTKRIIRHITAVFLALTVLTSHIPMWSIKANISNREPIVDESGDFEQDTAKAVVLKVPYSGGAGLAPIAGFGNALDFKTNQRVNIPFNNSTKLGGNSDFTISMWACPEPGSPYQTLYRQHNVNSGALGVWLRYINANGGYLYFMFDEFDGIGWQMPWVWSSGPPAGLIKIPLNQWFHVAMTKSGKNVTVYVNGAKYYEMVLNNTHYNAPAPINATINIGGEATNNQNFDGRIDEVRFWNTALSESEIQAWIFREIDDTHPQYENLIFYYKMNQDTGTSVTDSKGSNHGTTVGMTNADWVASDVRGWTVQAGSSINGQLVGSDTDGSSSNGLNWNLSFEIVTPPSKGTAVITGDNRFRYTAYIDKQGIDTFTYKVKDPTGKYSNTHIQNINILPAVFRVSFVTNGGSSVADQNIVYGGKVTAPANPTKSGYTFAGWYKEPGFINKWLFGTDTIKSDTVLYAKWELITIISVDVTWGSMDFTYSEGTWNPGTHQYVGSGWKSNANANKISVTSTSNVLVTISYSYTKEPGYNSVNGSFSDGINPIASHVLPAGNVTPKSCNAYLILSGKPTECNASKIGSVTVTIDD